MPQARPEQQPALFQKMNAACCGAIPLQICPAFASALCPPTTSNTSYTSRCAWRGPLNFVRRVGGRLSVMVMDGEPASRLYWTYWSTFWIHEEREIWIKLAVLNPAYQYFVPLIQSCSPIQSPCLTLLLIVSRLRQKHAAKVPIRCHFSKADSRTMGLTSIIAWGPRLHA